MKRMKCNTCLDFLRTANEGEERMLGPVAVRDLETSPHIIILDSLVVVYFSLL